MSCFGSILLRNRVWGGKAFRGHMTLVEDRSSQDYAALGLFEGVTRHLPGKLHMPAPLRRETKIGFCTCSMQACAERGILSAGKYSRNRASDGILDGARIGHGQHDRIRRISAACKPCALGMEFGHRMVDHCIRRFVRCLGLWHAQQGFTKGRRALRLHPCRFWRWRGLCDCLGILDFNVGRQCGNRDGGRKLS